MFRRNRFAPYPPPRPRCLTRLRTRCVARSFRLRIRFEHWSFQVFSRPQNTHIIYDMHARSRNRQEHHHTTACCSSPPKQPMNFFTRLSLTDVYRFWSSRTESNLQYFFRPGSCCRYHPINTFRPGRHHDTTACSGSDPKEPIIPPPCRLTGVIQTRVLPNRK